MIIIPIGVDCTIAGFIKQDNLRYFSLPFDWCVTYNGVSNIINNKFQDFLPKDNNLNCKSSHTFFMHNRFPSDMDKMNRRIKRFLELLDSDNELLFIRKSHSPRHHNESQTKGFDLKDDISDMEQLYIYLKNNYPNLKFKIILFLVCGNSYTNECKSAITDIKIYHCIDKQDNDIGELQHNKFAQFYNSVKHEFYTTDISCKTDLDD